MILDARLPVRFLDDLTIEVDPDAAGKRLTPAQGLALAERLTYQAIHHQVAERCRKAAVPMVGKVRP